MDTEELREIFRQAIKAGGTNLYRVATENNLPENALRSFVHYGKEPKIGRFIELCDALGLTLTVAAAPPSLSPKDAAMLPVSDPKLAELLAAIDPRLAELFSAMEKHWEALDNEYSRRTWLAQLFVLHPELAHPPA